jgi:hypothetical protein
MADREQEVPWEGQRVEASYEFALRCRELRESYPYQGDHRLPSVLHQITEDLVTELWDQGFSQTEISAAFKGALETLPRYTAGEDRRGDKG